MGYNTKVSCVDAEFGIGRELGVKLWGPDLKDVISEMNREWVDEACKESLRWHAEHGEGNPNGVLNACRGWR